MTAAELAEVVKPLKIGDWPAGLEYDPPTPRTPVPHCYYSWWMKSLNDGPVDSRGGWNARYPLTTNHAAAIFGWWLCVKYEVYPSACMDGTWCAQDRDGFAIATPEDVYDHPLKAIVQAVVSTYPKDHP